MRLEEYAEFRSFGADVTGIPLSMLNVLSDMEGVWAGLCGGECARVCGGVLQAVQIQPLAL